MTDKPPIKLLVVLSSTRARAVEVAARQGVEPSRVLWPRSVSDLAGRDDLPLYADVSLWDHPRADDMAGYFATRVLAGERQRARETQLARGRSSALN